jgi:tetratricopeptide (TPR) repeat protein
LSRAVPGDAFVKSFAQHILPTGLRKVRYYGCLELQDYVAARVVLADAARLNPGDPAARFYHGVALEYSGDRENGIHEYEAALKIRPDYEAVRISPQCQVAS